MKRAFMNWQWVDRNFFTVDIKAAAALVWSLPLVHLITSIALIYFCLQMAGTGRFSTALLIAIGSAGCGVSLLLGIFCRSMLFHQHRQPLTMVDGIFRQLGEGSVDLSRELDKLPYDGLDHVHSGYNRFMAQIRNLIENIRNMGVRIAIDSTKVRKTIDTTVEKIKQQADLTERVTLSSNDANTAIGDLSEKTQYVSENTTTNLENARQAFSELVDVREKIDQIVRTVNSFRDTVDELGRNSTGIMEIVGLINNISEETNLLSLNATIEAARAGQHGKGFAVVAEEVRILAKRVKPATQDIAEKVDTMIATVARTKAETETIMQFSADVGQIVNHTAGNFEAMTRDLEGTNEQLLKIAAGIEELTINNSEINSKVSDIDRFAHEIDADMAESATSVRGLNQITEKMQEMVSHYKTGQGVLDRIITAAREHRDAIQSRIAAMKKRGINVFDRTYRPIPGTNPQKYATSYTDAFKEAFQTYVDDTLKDIPGAIYALAVDEKGYLPIHHGKFSQPMTGDHQKDLLYSRDRRIYNSNPTETRRAGSKAPMLLQTYMRDTGEVLNDLSMPITIDGRHWGGFILGLNPDIFISKAAK